MISLSDLRISFATPRERSLRKEPRMSELLRRLNPDGIAQFSVFLEAARTSSAPLPLELLTHASSSSPLETDIAFSPPTFADRLALGKHLVQILSPLDRRRISRDAGLWTWLALRLLDQLAPPDANGKRRILSNEAYVLPTKYDFRGYYRHLVRTPWMVVADHGSVAEVLLIPVSAGKGAALSTRGEIIEQLASRQGLLRNRRVIGAVHKMYWDSGKARPKKGAGGSGAGSPRRLALLLRQFDLTYDLDAAADTTIVGLMPKDFQRWKS
jgi:hypothetical protein